MADPETSPRDASPDHGDTHTSRLELLWEVLVFQFKLALDGLRDLLLSPLSLGAAILGLFFGADEPARYFRRVLNFGRRTETWINLFGHEGRAGTADHLAESVRERVVSRSADDSWMHRSGAWINRKLDGINAAFVADKTTKPDD